MGKRKTDSFRNIAEFMLNNNNNNNNNIYLTAIGL